VAAFDGERISGNPARFDRKKAEAINSTHLRMLAPADFAARLADYVVAAGRLSSLTANQHAVVQRAAPLVQERCILLKDAAEMVGFLLVDEAAFEIDPTAAVKVLTPEAGPPLAAAVSALEPLERFDAAAIEAALKAALIEKLGLKPRVAFASVRVGATGRTISPPLFQSLELLGRDRTLLRLRAAQHLAER
jgi:glutamyl-tRNA synthetase